MPRSVNYLVQSARLSPFIHGRPGCPVHGLVCACDPQRPSQVDEPRLREVLGWIELNQKLWSQQSWGAERSDGCGTTHCVAGWTVALEDGEDFVLREMIAPVYSRPRTMMGNPVPDRAAELLGLSEWQACRLFFFVCVPDGKDRMGFDKQRHPTFAELCDRVFEVTGIRYKPAEMIDAS